jgi:TPR repeat protein
MMRLGEMDEAAGQAESAAQWYRGALDAGQEAAAARLGRLYARGQGVPQDQQQALLLYERGAQARDPDAMTALAERVESESPQRAAELYRVAAELGNPEAMARYAGFLEHGKAGVQQNFFEAVVWYRKAADEQHPAASTRVGTLYETGTVLERDPAAAYRLYRSAADAGYAPAMTRAGSMHERGLGAARDLEAAHNLYRAAATGGDPAGMTALARLIEPANLAEALGLYRRAAERGDTNAMGRLAEIDTDTARRTEWTRRAAEAGHVPSMVRLGESDEIWLRRAAGAGDPQAMRRYGESLRDPADRARWLRRAAEAGDGAAMAGIGLAYERGEGVPLDTAQARTWYRAGMDVGDRTALGRLCLLEGGSELCARAAEAGYPEAMTRMGELRERAADKTEALRWYRRAADAGDAHAWTRLALLAGDSGERRQLLNRAAHAGDAEARLHLGDLEAGQKKYHEAIHFYREAAGAGVPAAMVRMGDLTMDGRGTSRNEPDAVNWYRKAVDAGSAEAMLKLADAYERRAGWMRNVEEAQKLRERAALAETRRAAY